MKRVAILVRQVLQLFVEDRCNSRVARRHRVGLSRVLRSLSCAVAGRGRVCAFEGRRDGQRRTANSLSEHAFWIEWALRTKIKKVA